MKLPHSVSAFQILHVGSIHGAGSGGTTEAMEGVGPRDKEHLVRQQSILRTHRRLQDPLKSDLQSRQPPIRLNFEESLEFCLMGWKAGVTEP